MIKSLFLLLWNTLGNKRTRVKTVTKVCREGLRIQWSEWWDTESIRIVFGRVPKNKKNYRKLEKRRLVRRNFVNLISSRTRVWGGRGWIGQWISRLNPARVKNHLQRSSDVRGGRAESPGGRAESAGRRRRRSGRRSSVHGTVELALAPVRHQVLVVATLFGIVPEVRVVRVRRTKTANKKNPDQSYARSVLERTYGGEGVMGETPSPTRLSVGESRIYD